jgi:hypothetical protein
MAGDSPTEDARSPVTRSRITNGSDLLPTVDGRSVWARLMRDTLTAMVQHCGGPNHVTEPMRLMARRVAALEAELIFLEDRFAGLRAEGAAPKPHELDLYGRLAGGQRRLLETLGMRPLQRDVTPDPLTYARQRGQS